VRLEISVANANCNESVLGSGWTITAWFETHFWRGNGRYSVKLSDFRRSSLFIAIAMPSLAVSLRPHFWHERLKFNAIVVSSL
jgi:hypothetical protein